jgi:hypothetical protein
MPAAEARIPTARAARYLGQLADHLAQLGHLGPGGPNATETTGHLGDADHGRHTKQGGQDQRPGHGHGGPPPVRHVERTEGRARIEFDWGDLQLAATSTELVLCVQADHVDALARGQALVKHRLETIGRRDALTVNWQSSHGA